MLKKYIPEKYDISDINISQLITDAVGRNFEITVVGRLVIIPSEELTLQEKLAIRDAFISAVTEVGSIDI